MASKKAATKGKRYSTEEKREIVKFAEAHNAQNGRGGVTAAAKKFGASPLSIASWLKTGVASSLSPNVKASRGGISIGNRSKALAELSRLDGVIAVKRKELDALEARFQKLKASL